MNAPRTWTWNPSRSFWSSPASSSTSTLQLAPTDEYSGSPSLRETPTLSLKGMVVLLLRVWSRRLFSGIKRESGHLVSDILKPQLFQRGECRRHQALTAPVLAKGHHQPRHL